MHISKLVFLFLLLVNNAFAEGNWVANISLGLETSDKSKEQDSDGQPRALLYGGAVGILGIETPTFLNLALDARILLATTSGKFSYQFLRNGTTYTDQRLQGSMVRTETGLGLKWNLLNFQNFKMFIGAMGIIGRAAIAYDIVDYSSRNSNQDGLLISEDQSYTGTCFRGGLDFLGQEFGFRLSAELVDYKTKKFETLNHSTLTHQQIQYLLSYLQRF